MNEIERTHPTFHLQYYVGESGARRQFENKLIVLCYEQSSEQSLSVALI